MVNLEIAQQVTIESITQSIGQFTVYDYAVFGVMLISCSLIGIYFGYKNHQKSKSNQNRSQAKDYLMGGGKMQVLPVAMSLTASFISGITLLGTSTEIYLYGTQYCYILIAYVLSCIFMYYTIIPVFHDLNITSTYEVNLI